MSLTREQPYDIINLANFGNGQPLPIGYTRENKKQSSLEYLHENPERVPFEDSLDKVQLNGSANNILWKRFLRVVQSFKVQNSIMIERFWSRQQGVAVATVPTVFEEVIFSDHQDNSGVIDFLTAMNATRKGTIFTASGTGWDHPSSALRPFAAHIARWIIGLKSCLDAIFGLLWDAAFNCQSWKWRCR